MLIRTVLAVFGLICAFIAAASFMILGMTPQELAELQSDSEMMEVGRGIGIFTFFAALLLVGFALRAVHQDTKKE